MAFIQRETKETKISCKLARGIETKIDTKIGFLDHMLEALSKHSLIGIELSCDGDIWVDYHHSVEDIAIVLGQCLREEFFPVKNIERFSNNIVVMDESAVECIIDISNRPFLYFDIELDGKVGDFDCELVEEFFRALVFNFGITCHLVFQRGKNKHHIIEATFKAFAVSLRRALSENKELSIPSTKGVI